MHTELPLESLPPEQTPFLVRPILIETPPEEPHESPHRHDFQEILWIRSGWGEQVIDGRRFDVRPQTIYLIARRQVHQFLTGVDVDGLVLRFKDEFLPQLPFRERGHYQTALFHNVTINHTLPIPPSESAGLETLLAQIRAEFEGAERPGRVEILRHLLLVLLIKLEQIEDALQRERQRETPADARRFQRFLRLLDEQLAESHQVRDYARQLHITPKQLSNLSRQFMGQTAKQIIDERIALEARRLLTFTNLSVKEIAHALGFKDPSYFSKVFKKHAGVSPQDFPGDLVS